MTGILLRQTSLTLLLGLATPLALAADLHGLLVRMNHAAQNLDYEGTFIYQRGDQLESLRIFHKVTSDGTQERLVSLNGAPREIIRTQREVRCYLPDENAVMVEHRRADGRSFPSLLPESLASLKNHYRLRVGKDGRVAGRKAKSVFIKPRDGYRYGYLLWADESTGLLLKASLLDENAAVVEQYMFSQISIGQPIPDSDLQPQNLGKGYVWRSAAQPSPGSTTGERWRAERLPAGFALTARVTRQLPGQQQPVEHLVYSDGLAVVSVFIETAESSARATALSGLSQMGSVHAYGKIHDGYQITVVGEAPAATVDMIGESVVVERQP